ncbi:alpha/beta hydrolase [Legionella quateirensis]|uniref:Enterobactin/ferric enterobactin esterase n=1 Tax=Legionella quateirensis TaxID=45072 RepID=A0A378KTL5_9GAMM|nr:alpha/beta hydrolase-fold protein [Legionella quateirensis]KTD44655.1 enterobactin/ferric enterobactin esterase [Legionella quateirensis]STY16827.1 enterobactin/ferric enterobactin esterase [Legionella quateirensis]
MAIVKKFLFINTLPCALEQINDDYEFNDLNQTRGDRIIYIHQPVTAPQLGILICLDGENEISSIVTEQIESTPDILDRLYKEDGHTKQLAVFIPAPPLMRDRVAEYACNPDFTSFLHDQLLPLLQRPLSEGGLFECSTDREQIAISGVSMSAVAAVHTVLKHPNTFSKALVQSGAFWWYRGWEKECSFDAAQLDLSVGKMEWLDAHEYPPYQPDLPISFYLQAGKEEKGFDGFPTFATLHNDLEQKLIAKGHQVKHELIDGGSHSYDFWQKHKESAFRQMGFASLGINSKLTKDFHSFWKAPEAAIRVKVSGGQEESRPEFK